MSSGPHILVVGIGNALRGDDGAGLAAAQRLQRAELPAQVRVQSLEGEPLHLLERWSGADVVVIIDTVQSGAAPGSVHRLDVSRAPLPTSLRRTSSHAIGLAETIELARVLQRLPATVIVFGIEGANFRAGADLGEPIQRAVTIVSEQVREEARRLQVSAGAGGRPASAELKSVSENSGSVNCPARKAS